MQIGLKIGPRNWQDVLARVTPECLEVWFRLDWQDQFQEMFSVLQKRKIPFGIHFWAVTSQGLEPNLAIETDGLAQESAELMRQNIDIAAKVGAHYLNIHPGGLRRKRLEFEHSRLLVLDSEPIPLESAWDSLQKYAQELHSYAQKKGVLLFFETLPKNETMGWDDPNGRLQTQAADNLSPEILLRLGEQGFFLTNDFGHTIASYPELQGKQLEERFIAVTERLAPFTRLIHLNTVSSPFNGTDSHNGILPVDFAQPVLPRKSVCQDILRQFRAREDVWTVLEAPIPTMVENYEELVRWKASAFQDS